jgi:hypothetical protein
LDRYWIDIGDDVGAKVVLHPKMRGGNWSQRPVESLVLSRVKMRHIGSASLSYGTKQSG